MDSELKQMLGGSLRPGDPRRYLIEAMVGAMCADGHEDPRELDVLHRHLAEHELFANLAAETARVLIELARDAVQLAHDGRVDAIARGLPARTHRLAAFAMVCEVCVADNHIDQAEVAYMAALRQSLCLSAHEADDLLTGARHGMPMDVLEEKIARLVELMPCLVECFALQHRLERRVLRRHQKRLLEHLIGLVDMRVAADELEREIARAFDPLQISRDVNRAMDGLAARVDDAEDRYWFAVYILAGYLRRGRGDDIANSPFLALLVQQFHLADLDGAREHARRLLDPRGAS